MNLELASMINVTAHSATQMCVMSSSIRCQSPASSWSSKLISQDAPAMTATGIAP
jgi:hypothetical protein